MTKAKGYKRYSAAFKREAILRAGEEGVTGVHHRHETDHLVRTVEIPDRILHPGMLRNLANRLKPI